MTDRQLLVSLAASLTIHLALLPVASRFFNSKHSIVLPLPIQLVEVPHVKHVEESEPTSPETVRNPKPEKITAPKLLSKPQIFGSRAPIGPNNATELKKKTGNFEAHGPSRSTDLPETPLGGDWNIIAGKLGEAGGVASGEILIPSGGETTSGLDRGSKGVAGDGGIGRGKVSSTDARPLEGHQFKPRYPDSARRARAQGTTFLKFRVLATGKVEEVFVEKSAGRRDLDEAAAEAVKRWLFEPARMGTEPLSVWVILPVEFKLN